jgi:serine/threonine-protein kinase
VEANTRGVTFGRYVLAERLGKGGMGEVYLAVQTGIGSFEKPLALKLLLPHLSSRADAVQMFLEEARLAARMNHGNVTQIFDVGVIDGRYFMAMELVQGVSLDKLIGALARTGKRPEPELVLCVARALCDGLHHAHEQRGPDGRPLGLVHRDVTPHNVLVSLDGAVKLADFGIARAQGPADDTERLAGKLAYLPPEQLKGAPVDRRGDLYAAALTLVHFATLTQPFQKSDREQTVAAVLNGPSPSLAGLPEVLQRALDRDPAKRPATARELAAALPAASSDATARLGALVREACATEVQVLVEKTNHAVKLQRTATDPLPGARDQQVTQPQAPARRWPFAVGALIVLAAVMAGVTLRSAAPAPVAAAAALHGVGYLTIDADPWASVFVNQKSIGETPLESFPVESGRVTLELKNAETGRKVTRMVDVAPGQHAYVKESLR